MITADERLALLAALDKKVSPAFKAAKSDACGELMARCAEDGTDRRAVLVGGEKVGDVAVRYTKGHPVIIDMTQALDCLREMGLTEEIPAKGWESHFARVGDEVVATDTAELCGWAQWESPRPKDVRVSISDPQVVLDAFGARLSGNPLALLEEGVA